jgi:hypothetical protein
MSERTQPVDHPDRGTLDGADSGAKPESRVEQPEPAR